MRTTKEINSGENKRQQEKSINPNNLIYNARKTL